MIMLVIISLRSFFYFVKTWRKPQYQGHLNPGYVTVLPFMILVTQTLIIVHERLRFGMENNIYIIYLTDD